MSNINIQAMPYDILPDIHGQAAKVLGLLECLGHERIGGDWRHGESDRQLVFLGDFIDGGPRTARS